MPLTDVRASGKILLLEGVPYRDVTYSSVTQKETARSPGWVEDFGQPGSTIDCAMASYRGSVKRSARTLNPKPEPENLLNPKP